MIPVQEQQTEKDKICLENNETLKGHRQKRKHESTLAFNRWRELQDLKGLKTDPELASFS